MKGYQLRISVHWSDPEIWRRVLIPGKITFWDLHRMIQKLFGWENNHTYEFYMEKTGVNLSGNPMQAETGITPEKILIDDFLRKEDHIWYVYDPGDSWEHLIEIEKTVEVECRWPQVLDAEGPNMIEDCGGILEFERNREDAGPFLIDRVNRWFRANMDFPKRQREILLRTSVIKSHWEETDHLEGMLTWLQGSDPKYDRKVRREILETGIPKELSEVFGKWSKDDLCELARECRFRGYSRLKKKELAVWMQDQLLDEDVMFQRMKKSSPGELQIFEKAVREGIVRTPEDQADNYDFLWAYCGYDPRGYLVVPENVRTACEKVLVPKRRQELKNMWKIRDFCRGAVYLYGMISVAELKKIWKQYEGVDPDAALMKEYLQGCRDAKGSVLYDGRQLMDEWLEDREDREKLEKEREGLDRYLPEAMKDFLRYGREGRQTPGRETESVVRFYQKKLSSREEALGLFYDIQDRVRVLGSPGGLSKLLRSQAIQVPRGKPEYEWAGYIRQQADLTRSWLLNGFTFREASEKYPDKVKKNPEDEEKQAFVIPSNKKIYPNDPCPCGSGKKYKHCCGKNR